MGQTPSGFLIRGFCGFTGTGKWLRVWGSALAGGWKKNTPRRSGWPNTERYWDL